MACKKHGNSKLTCKECADEVIEELKELLDAAMMTACCNDCEECIYKKYCDANSQKKRG